MSGRRGSMPSSPFPRARAGLAEGGNTAFLVPARPQDTAPGGPLGAASREEGGAAGRLGRQRGLTLVEMMVALVISLLLLAGLVTVFVAMNSSFSTTRQLNHLVAQQRLASTVLENTISAAGFWPIANRTVRLRFLSSAAAFPTDNVAVAAAGGVTFSFVAGQVIAGRGGGGAGATDVIATRVLTAPPASAGAPQAGVFNCQGGTNGNTIEHWVNVIWVDTAENELKCTVLTRVGGNVTPSTATILGGNLLPVAGVKYAGVRSMSVAYGVDVNADGSVDRYMRAPTLNSGAGAVCPDVVSGVGHASDCWPYVRSARVTLRFVSALDPSETFSLTRNIVLANAIGRYCQPDGCIPMGPSGGNT